MNREQRQEQVGKSYLMNREQRQEQLSELEQTKAVLSQMGGTNHDPATEIEVSDTTAA